MITCQRRILAKNFDLKNKSIPAEESNIATKEIAQVSSKIMEKVKELRNKIREFTV